jgi:hypothetical protein
LSFINTHVAKMKRKLSPASNPVAGATRRTGSLKSHAIPAEEKS